MFSLSIVKHFKVFKHRLPCFCSCLICLLLDTLLLYCSKERLHESIIIAITFSTHADFYSILFEQRLVTRAGILASPVRVMQQTSRLPVAALLPLLLQMLSIAPGKLFSHRPSNHKAGIDIDDGCKIEPSFPGFNTGNIGYPLGIWCISRKITIQ